MLRGLRTLSPIRLRQALMLPGAARESARPMAIPVRAPALSMAVPIDDPGSSRAMQLLAASALALALAGLWGQENVVSLTQIALDGLRDHRALAVDIDAADVPAMEPSLARVVDPRARPSTRLDLRGRQVAVQPFVYRVRAGETLKDIAVRFGTDVSALLWNNGLESADQVEAGAQLTVLPVRGVLHLVKAGETLAAIAERYGSRLDDLVLANALDGEEAIAPGQVLVVAGGSVPAPVAQMLQAADGSRLESTAIIGELGPPVRPAAPPAPREPRAERLPEPTGAAGWQRDFIMSVAPGARASQCQSGVPASVTLAQAILESDWGRSKLTREAKNLFGIKATTSGGTAGVYEINTWEVYDGQNVTVFAAFKAYTSLADSIADHGNWFHDNSRYHGALEVRDDPRAFAYAINAAGYATDPAYAPKLIGLMDRFNLYAYDVQPGQ